MVNNIMMLMWNVHLSSLAKLNVHVVVMEVEAKLYVSALISIEWDIIIEHYNKTIESCYLVCIALHCTSH